MKQVVLLPNTSELETREKLENQLNTKKIGFYPPCIRGNLSV